MGDISIEPWNGTGCILTPEELTTYSTWVVGFAALYTLFSGADYILSNRLYITRLLGIVQRVNKA